MTYLHLAREHRYFCFIGIRGDGLDPSLMYSYPVYPPSSLPTLATTQQLTFTAMHLSTLWFSHHYRSMYTSIHIPTYVAYVVCT